MLPFFLTKYFFNFLEKKLDIYTMDWLKFWQTWFELCLRAKNDLHLPEKSQKLGNFGNKKAPQYYDCNFENISIDVSCGFGFFSCQTTSGHGYTSRDPIWHLCCGFCWQLSKNSQNRFSVGYFVFFERPVCFYFTIFIFLLFGSSFVKAIQQHKH